MNQEWELSLQEEFPFMKQNHEDSERNIYRRWGIECSSGWSGIIREACRKIRDKYDEAGIPIDFETAQCKEKFGRLRWYFGYTDAPCGIAAFDNLADGSSLRFEAGVDSDDEEKNVFRHEIAAIVREAEAKSKCTCEICGAAGELRDDRELGIHWIKTLCDSCHENRIKSYEEARLKREKDKSKYEE